MEGSSVATQVELVNGYAVNVSLDGPGEHLSVIYKCTFTIVLLSVANAISFHLFCVALDKVLTVGGRKNRPVLSVVPPAPPVLMDPRAAMLQHVRICLKYCPYLLMF